MSQLEKGEKGGGNLTGETVALEVDDGQGGDEAEVGGDGPNKSVEAEGEDAQSGEVAKGGGGDGAAETNARETELGDAGGVAGDALPGAGGICGVPAEGGEAEGGPEGEESGSVRVEVLAVGRGGEEGEGEEEEKPEVFAWQCHCRCHVSVCLLLQV